MRLSYNNKLVTIKSVSGETVRLENCIEDYTKVEIIFTFSRKVEYFIGMISNLDCTKKKLLDYDSTPSNTSSIITWDSAFGIFNDETIHNGPKGLQHDVKWNPTYKRIFYFNENCTQFLESCIYHYHFTVSRFMLVCIHMKSVQIFR